ncbi:retron St85 family effector protein [Marinobacter sediminum]|uniref:retron St85 family effector protein n=1 Tax=Marinobacter sediminum TaxID=256323 RepID=UPI00202EF031|nr:retron St85 family effector protein [Marinobacter sediminum]
MEKNLREKDLNQVSRIVKDRIFVPRSERKVTVFLCGGEVTNEHNARSKMASIFSKYPRYEVLYPEDLFDDLLAGQGQHSLLKLENILAESVDAIVLFPESPGSFAELGAFSNNTKLANKMIVVPNQKFKSDKSFINYGPIRLVKSSKSGKVTQANYEKMSEKTEQHRLYRRVNDYITNIKKLCPVQKNVANILETENFILPCIYLIDVIDIYGLYRLMKYATSQDDSLCEIATRSALGRLAQKRLITRTSSGFQVTAIGREYVRATFRSTYLDRARVEILNAENRRNSSVSYDRVSFGAHL